MKHLLFFLVSAMTLGQAYGACVDLTGHYSNCQPAAGGTFTGDFELSQSMTNGSTVYAAKYNNNGQVETAHLMADGKVHPAQVDGQAPTNFVYQATCDQTKLSGTTWDPTLSANASDRVTFTRGAGNTINGLDEKLLFGRVVNSKSYSCQRVP